MKPKKKSKVFTFICSFMPGAAEMYMGFMRNGLSITGLFFATIMLVVLLSLDDVFICFVFDTWLFGFFHARNLASADDAEIEKLEDIPVWEEYTDWKSFKLNEKHGNKWIAWALIIVGIIVLINNFEYIISGFVPNSIWYNYIEPYTSSIPGIILAILFIIGGIKLIKGKKEELGLDNPENEASNEEKKDVE